MWYKAIIARTVLRKFFFQISEMTNFYDTSINFIHLYLQVNFISSCLILAKSTAFKPLVGPKTIGLTKKTQPPHKSISILINNIEIHSWILKKNQARKTNNARFPLSYSNLAQHMVPGQRQVTLHQVIRILQSIPTQRKPSYLRIFTIARANAGARGINNYSNRTRRGIREIPGNAGSGVAGIWRFFKWRGRALLRRPPANVATCPKTSARGHRE